MSEKLRLDVEMVKRGLAETREKAKAMIMSGSVMLDNDRCDKAGTVVKEDSIITLKTSGVMPYVSRGGLKLHKAMELYGLDLTDCVCMDIGASTGGFTDCMLQSGAKKVYAVDVGYGQLAWKLRTDERVINMERTNIRYVTEEQIGEKLDFASIDVSFISLTLVTPVLKKLLKENKTSLWLVKPQFEAGKEKVGKKGVVRELSTHIEVCKNIYDFATELGFSIIGATFSPIKGPQGNIEYLYYVENGDNENKINFDTIENMVKQSHKELNNE